MSLAMAGRLGKYLTKGLTKGGKLDYGQLGMRLAPDIGLSAFHAATTPGDMGDKLISFGSSLVPSTLGGLSAAGLAKNPHGMLAGTLDTMGSVAADYAAYPIGESLMRAKDKLGGGKGQTPYERMGEREQAIFAERLRRQILAEYGLGTYAGMG